MLTPITDTHGNLLVPSTEPHPGSIVMTDGEWGTAWQRHFSTGDWHPTRGGGSKPWAILLQRRNLVLVYSASPRPEPKCEDYPHTHSAKALGLHPVDDEQRRARVQRQPNGTLDVEVHTWADGRGN